MTTKLVDAVNLRKERADEDWWAESRVAGRIVCRVEGHLGGEENMKELDKTSKDIKEFAMKSLRTSLAKWLPVLAVEEDILDNILGHIDVEQDVGEDWKFVESTEEEKLVIDSLYSCLSEIYRLMRKNLFRIPPLTFGSAQAQAQALIKQLQGVVSQIYVADKEIEDCGGGDEDKRAEEGIDDGAAQGSKKEDEDK